MNSFELQTESEANADRQRCSNSHSASSTTSSSKNSNNTGSMMSHFNSMIPPQAPPPPPPPSIQSNLTARAKAQSDTKRLIDPTGNILNVVEDHKYAVFVSCVEIYNNYIYDLLDDTNINSADSARYNK
jgi:hypothetical protein